MARLFQMAGCFFYPSNNNCSQHFPHSLTKKTCKYEKLICTLFFKVLYMDSQHQPLEALQDIKRMMERSSRFISLSGWSGIAAGICALGGAWAAFVRLEHTARGRVLRPDYEPGQLTPYGATTLINDLLWIAGITFLAALVSAFLFTWMRSRRHGVPIWDRTVQRLTWNTLLPMAVGGLVIIRAMQLGYFELVAPGCLIFYGLALVNASKYTLGEIRYLGYCQLVLGIINLWLPSHGLYFWAAGFGVLHIIYGIVMWWKYERANQ